MRCGLASVALVAALWSPDSLEFWPQMAPAYDLAKLTPGQARALNGKRAAFWFRCPANRTEKVEDGSCLFLYCELKEYCFVIVALPNENELPTEVNVEATLRIEKGFQRDYIVYRLERPVWRER